MKYIINGGQKLSGEITISGNKNSVFPCIGASLLTNEEVVLENVGRIKDTEILVKILKELGVWVKREDHSITINASNIKTSVLPKDLTKMLRGSVVLAGAILARFKRVSFYHPGGDIIGKRSIDMHIEGFESLGASIKKQDLRYIVEFKDDLKKDAEIFLFESSVTAAENIILASVLGKREIILKNCPKEPHIVDLCKMLNQMGANIEGVGTDVLKIKGVDKLFGTKFRIGCDYIEMGTYAIAATITGGTIKIKNIDDTDINPVLIPLSKFGIEYQKGNGEITFSPGNLKSVSKLHTNIWPGFPTDLISAAIVLATQCRGVSLCHDWMYESRMFFVDKLISMGANIVLADPHRCLVSGITKLKARDVESPDIRAGMALVLAALIAKGKSVINKAELIERGYEDPVSKLASCGADIRRVEL